MLGVSHLEGERQIQELIDSKSDDELLDFPSFEDDASKIANDYLNTYDLSEDQIEEYRSAVSSEIAKVRELSDVDPIDINRLKLAPLPQPGQSDDNIREKWELWEEETKKINTSSGLGFVRKGEIDNLVQETTTQAIRSHFNPEDDDQKDQWWVSPKEAFKRISAGAAKGVTGLWDEDGSAAAAVDRFILTDPSDDSKFTAQLSEGAGSIVPALAATGIGSAIGGPVGGGAAFAKTAGGLVAGFSYNKALRSSEAYRTTYALTNSRELARESADNQVLAPLIDSASDVVLLRLGKLAKLNPDQKVWSKVRDRLSKLGDEASVTDKLKVIKQSEGKLVKAILNSGTQFLQNGTSEVVGDLAFAAGLDDSIREGEIEKSLTEADRTFLISGILGAGIQTGVSAVDSIASPTPVKDAVKAGLKLHEIVDSDGRVRSDLQDLIEKKNESTEGSLETGLQAQQNQSGDKQPALSPEAQGVQAAGGIATPSESGRDVAAPSAESGATPAPALEDAPANQEATSSEGASPSEAGGSLSSANAQDATPEFIEGPLPEDKRSELKMAQDFSKAGRKATIKDVEARIAVVNERIADPETSHFDRKAYEVDKALLEEDRELFRSEPLRASNEGGRRVDTSATESSLSDADNTQSSRPFPEVEAGRDSFVGEAAGQSTNLREGAESYFDSLAEAATDRSRGIGIDVVIGEEGSNRVTYDGGGGGIVIHLNKDRVNRSIDSFSDTGDGSRNRVAQDLERVVQEELIHGAYLVDLRDQWRSEGSPNSFVAYVEESSRSEFQSLREELSTLSEQDQKAIVSGVKQGTNFYDAQTALKGNTVAAIFDDLESRSIPQRAEILSETVRQMVQMRESGRLRESRSHGVIGPAIGAVRNILKRIRKASKTLEQQGSSFPVQRLIESTEVKLQEAEKTISGVSGKQNLGPGASNVEPVSERGDGAVGELDRIIENGSNIGISTLPNEQAIDSEISRMESGAPPAPSDSKFSKAVYNTSSRASENGTLPRGVREIIRQANYRKGGYEALFSEMGNDLKKSISKYVGKRGGRAKRDFERSRVGGLAYRALRGDDAAMKALPDGVRPKVESARKSIDLLSQRLIDDGVVDGELSEKIGDNLGRYILREFRVFDPKANWNYETVKSEHPEVYSKALTEIMETGGVTEKEADESIREMMDPARAQSIYMGVGKAGKVDATSFIKRKDMSPAILDLLGEVRDPVQNIRNTGKKISSILVDNHAQSTIREFLIESGLASEGKDVNQRFIQRVGEDDGGASKKSMQGFGRLHTSPELAEALDAYFASAKGSPSAWKAAGRVMASITGTGKFMQVILNPAAYPTNVAGGFWSEVLNGRISRSGALQYANTIAARKQTSYSIAEQQEFYNQTGEQFMGDGGSKKIRREAFKQEMAIRGIRDNSVYARDLTETIQKAAGEKAKKVAGAASKLYQVPDNAAKSNAFAYEVEKFAKAYPEKSISDIMDLAAADVRATTQNYDKVPQILKSASQYGLIVPTYVSFSWELVRNTVNTAKIAVREVRSGNPVLMKHGAARIAGMMAVGGALYTMNSLDAGSTEEEEEAVNRSFKPPWLKDQGVMMLGLSNGRVRYADPSYLIPHQLFFNAIENALNSDGPIDGVQEIANTMWNSFGDLNISSQVLAEVIANKKVGGGPIYNTETEQGGDKFKKIIEHSLKSQFTPGVLRTIQKAQKAEKGEIGYMGNTATYDDLAAQSIGLRPYTIDIKRAAQDKLKAFTFRYREASSFMSESKESHLSEEESKERQEKEDAAIERIKEELADFISDAKTLGKFSDFEIGKMVKAAGIQKALKVN